MTFFVGDGGDGVMLYEHRMKHVGADNFLLYVLCATATRAESLVKSGLGVVRKVLGREAKQESLPSDVKSSGSGRRLMKNRPAHSE